MNDVVLLRNFLLPISSTGIIYNNLVHNAVFRIIEKNYHVSSVLAQCQYIDNVTHHIFCL